MSALVPRPRGPLPMPRLDLPSGAAREGVSSARSARSVAPGGPHRARATLPRWTELLGRAAIAVWFVSSAFGAAYLLGAHVSGLPVPDPDDPRLAAFVGARRHAGRPLALHVLSAACECSRRIVARLEVRAPRRDVDEVLLFVGDAPASLVSVAGAEGFVVETTTPDALAVAAGVEVAPLMVVARADGRVAYVGGYTERRRGAVAQTEALLDAVLRGERPTALPVLGCATTARLAERVDPWGIR